LLFEIALDGADRQGMHELIRGVAMAAWDAVQQGKPNPLVGRLAADPEILRYLPAGRVRELLDASGHVGDAPERARQMAAAIREHVEGGVR
jgi:adenylosuccinate lyase